MSILITTVMDTELVGGEVLCITRSYKNNTTIAPRSEFVLTYTIHYQWGYIQMKLHVDKVIDVDLRHNGMDVILTIDGIEVLSITSLGNIYWQRLESKDAVHLAHLGFDVGKTNRLSGKG